jgi:beta-galactosidase
VAIELTDKNGILQTSSDKKVSLEIEGPGCIQGFGSADPWSEENFFNKERTTYYGRAVAVIRAGEEAGVIKLTARADGMEEASVEITVDADA